MWGDAKAQRSYVKANWMALQSMIRNRLEAHPELPTAVAESEKAKRFDQLREPTWRLCNRVLAFNPVDDDASLVHRMVQPPATAEEAKAQRERITEQANKFKYNLVGHVCPQTNRVAMTVAEVIKLQDKGDVYSHTYDEEAAGCGLDPWRLVDSINPFTKEPKAELWFANGGSRVVGTETVLYVQQPKAKK
jgi:hypothetical protein